MATYLGDGIYSVGKLERVWNTRKKELPNAVLPDDPEYATRRFGWFKGSIPTPQTGGFYIVEFLDDERIKVLAYVDEFGRAFTTEEGFIHPPAKEDDYFIALDDTGANTGHVLVRENGIPEHASRFTVRRMGKNSKYTFVDSWFDFGANGKDIDYFDFMTRGYLAFVYSTHTAGSAKPFSVDDVFATMMKMSPANAFEAIIKSVKETNDKPNIKVSPIVTRLAEELEAAGALALKDMKDFDIRLVRTKDYANTFFVGVEADEDKADPVLLWGIEGALNRFLLASTFFDDEQAVDTKALGNVHDSIMGFVGMQESQLGINKMKFQSRPGGVWEALSSISGGIENAKLPYRALARVAIDEQAKVLAMDVLVPTSEMMPKSKYVENDDAGSYVGTWMSLTQADRADMAMRYALSLGLLMVTIAFESAKNIDLVDITLRPAVSEGNVNEALEQGIPKNKLAWCKAQFTREDYEASNGFKEAKAKDPYDAYYKAHAKFSVEGVDPFDVIKQQPTYVSHNSLMNMFDVPISVEAQAVFGGKTREDLSIYFDAAMRTVGERIADAVARSNNTSEAVKEVLALQEAVEDIEPREDAAYKRLLEALAVGAVDTHDQNAIVNTFLGEDECDAAFKRSRVLEEEGQAEKAVEVLSNAISNTTLKDSFIDKSDVVYRYFDSYASRIIYNLVREGSLDGPAAIKEDTNKKVELAPDSLYMCMLRAADILEDSFERTDEAIRYCERAITIGPTAGVAYRQLGRIHMLIGDLDLAANVLTEGLKVMIQPNDIAGTYYQLAYVLWKSGKPQAGALCYLKSIATSRIVASAASSELNELIEENSMSVDDFPAKEELDGLLIEQGIIAAPSQKMLDSLTCAAAAAVDEGLYPVARNLLALTLSYRNDDAIVSLVRYIEEI